MLASLLAVLLLADPTPDDAFAEQRARYLAESAAQKENEFKRLTEQVKESRRNNNPGTAKAAGQELRAIRTSKKPFRPYLEDPLTYGQIGRFRGEGVRVLQIIDKGNAIAEAVVSFPLANPISGNVRTEQTTVWLQADVSGWQDGEWYADDRIWDVLKTATYDTPLGDTNTVYKLKLVDEEAILKDLKKAKPAEKKKTVRKGTSAAR